MPNEDELARVCANCNYAFVSEPFASDYAICLNDPEFEPYLDELLDKQDFSRCQDLVRNKRFPWEHEACDKFDPMDSTEPENELPPRLTATIQRLADEKRLTPETLQEAVLQEAVNRIDWSKVPVDSYVTRLRNAQNMPEWTEAIRSLGGLIAMGNRLAFDALLSYLRGLSIPRNLDEVGLRVLILENLDRGDESQKVLAKFLVEDLFKTPSNNTTRGWYTAVFRFFRCVPPEIAEEALTPILESPQFSYRIKKRVKQILGYSTGDGFFI